MPLKALHLNGNPVCQMMSLDLLFSVLNKEIIEDVLLDRNNIAQIVKDYTG